MDFGRAFTYAFEDPDWLKKAGIAMLVLLIPLVGVIIVAGWGLEITRRLIKDESPLLPDWDDFGGHAVRGFKGLAVALGYSLPVILIVACGQIISVSATTMASNSQADLVNTVVMVATLCISCFGLVFGLLAGLLIPPALGSLAVTNEVGAAFRFQEVFGLLRAAIGPYLLSLVILLIALPVLTSFGSLICGIGLLAGNVYAQLLSAHLYGQAYKIAKAALPVA